MRCLIVGVHKVNHNRLERLSAEVLQPRLQESIRLLWLAGNNLVELPPIFDGASCLVDLQAERNPLRSPPADVLVAGAAAVRKYCQLRSQRLDEVASLLQLYGFEVDKSRFTPKAHQALTGATGYLRPDDLLDCDREIDRLVNGNFFESHPTAPLDLVDRLDALKWASPQCRAWLWW